MPNALDPSFIPRRDLLLGLTASALLACGSSSGLATVPQDPNLAPLERAMFERINRDRAARGLPALAYDVRLADVARFHADDMSKNRFFAHDSPSSGSVEDRLARAEVPVAIGRENLAEAADVSTAQDGLLKSPGHYENLMAKDITHVGVGIVRGGLLTPTNLLFVQVFARPVEKQTPAEARATVLGILSRGRKVIEDDTLNGIAEREVGALDDDVPPDQLAEIGKRSLSRAKQAGVQTNGLICTGQRVVAASEYTPPGGVNALSTLRIGLAVAEAKDEKGNPAVKVLLLIAN